MAKKKVSDVRRKQLKRIRQFISRAEQRGYRFPTGFADSLNNLSTQTLKSYTPEKLYTQFATAILEKTGEVVSGIERRAEERSEAAIKAAKTRIAGKLAESPEGKLLFDQLAKLAEESSGQSFTIEDVELSDNTDPYQDAIDSLLAEGDVVYERLIELINTHSSTGSERLLKALEEEISTYGYDRVVAALALAPEAAIKAAQEIVFYPNGGTTGSEAHKAFIKLGDIISGTVRSEQDSMDIGDVLDSMGYGESWL